ncbi:MULTISPECIES: Pentatricopeptide repeat-containing protein [Streptomyces]|uniref:Tetratricopeptide repeat protein n=1 Tax=Streptomyces sudanensis TaxID=436397 RepID=A0ABY4TG78_9ACTN|nr:MULTISPECIES: Pentatricopeptide repeat-containing protein [Streptomyces]URN17308.1 hypothetical protein MW084_16800 [Streptomyces sudanensis]
MKRKELRRAALKGDGRAALALADMLMDAYEEQEAVDVLRASAAAGAGGVALYLAEVLAVSGDEEYERQAEEWYRVAVDEGIPGALNDYGCFLSMHDDRLDEAEAVLLRAVEARDELSYGNLGGLYLDAERYDEALPWLRRGVAQGNRNLLPLLSRVETELGDADAAWEHARAAIEEDRDGARLACAVHLARFGEHHPGLSAETMFREAAEEDDSAHFLYANWLKDQGRSGEAEREYRAAIEAGEPNAHLNFAYLLEDLGREAEAEAELRAGIAAGDPWAAGGLARFLTDRGRTEEAPDLIRKAGELGCPQEEMRELWSMHRSL